MFRQIKEDITSVFHRDPAARNFVEVLTCYPGLHAILFHRASHWLWQRKLKWLARFISTMARFFTGIEIHPGAQIGHRFFIDHGMGIVIGETAVIGDDVTLYQGVTLGGTSLSEGKRHPTLHDGVVVGAGAKILGPFEVGKEAKIGSNAVVIKAVPAGATAVGVPGRVITEEDKALYAESSAERKEKFAAYGMNDDMPDPMAQSLSVLLDHMQEVENKMNELCAQLKSIDGNYADTKIPQLDQQVLADAKALCGDKN